MASRLLAATVLAALCAFPRPLAAEDAPLWPDEVEERLKELDKEILTVQRARFRGIFFGENAGDRAELEKRFRDVQRERRRLLRASGQ